MLLIPSTGKADDFGRWLCTSCTLGEPLAGQANGHTDTFIRSIVNAQGGPLDGRDLGDTVTVCNGVTCGTCQRALFDFVNNGSSPDDGSAHLNAPASGGGGGGGLGGPGFGGHWSCGTASGVGTSGTTCVWIITHQP